MKKALLIYNDNIPAQFVIDFEREIGATYKFQVGKQELLSTNFTIDAKIDETLKKEIAHDIYDCIFIPYSLSDENYLEFIGLRFACHIRLTTEFNNLQTPIIFFGYETESEINKLSEIGSILFSRGIYTTDKCSVQDFEKQIQYVLNNHKKIDDDIFLKQFTKRVVITPAGNYATHHSITNEWSIYRWATALKVQDEEIKIIEKKVGSNLYFKFLKAQFPIKPNVEVENQIGTEEGKILYIDDEIDKGWDNIFRTICIGKTFDSIGSNFKNVELEEIITTSLEKVKTLNPDVVILDFRLHDDDFENTAPENVTGYKILQGIKVINKGIQVIILSATNKIWNLMELQIAGADGFILKESPELSIDENYTKNAIRKIYETINDGLKRAKFLKKAIARLNEIAKFIEIEEYSEDFKLAIKSNLDIAFKLMYDSFGDSKYRNYSYIQLFLIIEQLVNHNSFLNGESDIRVKCHQKEVLVQQTRGSKIKRSIKLTSNGKYEIEQNEFSSDRFKRADTNFKVSSILIYRLGNPNSSVKKWTNIYKNRNSKAAHFDKDTDNIINQNDLIDILDFLMYFIDYGNISELNLRKGLPEKSLEEALDELKNDPRFTKQK